MRTAVNLIDETALAQVKERMLANVTDFIASTQKNGGKVYMLDARAYSQSHLEWLQAQTGLTPNELSAFGGAPAFACEGRSILLLPDSK